MKEITRKELGKLWEKHKRKPYAIGVNPYDDDFNPSFFRTIPAAYKFMENEGYFQIYDMQED